MIFTNKGKMHIILFDGVCNLCIFSIRFIIKRDKKAYFHFLSLQSDLGQKLLKVHELEEVDSIIYIDEEKAYTYSDAVLKVAKHLDGFWKYLYILHLLPKWLRDGIYKFIAKHRYKFFGKNEKCMLPTEDTRLRFLD